MRTCLSSCRCAILVGLFLATALLWGCNDDYVADWPQFNLEPRDYDETPDAGPLRLKAEGFDAWHLQWHQPDYGGTVNVRFTDAGRTQAGSLGGWGDSTIWTGTYLASQALRWYVSADPQARANAVRMVDTLVGHLRVTETPGYIARYWGPQTSLIYQGDDWCEAQERCFHKEEAPFAGDFWWGSTSRDQYIGWFLGMCLAYDLVDDGTMREKVREAVVEVVHTLIDHNWTIIAEDEQPSGTAPDVLPTARLAFALIGYHVSGDEKIKTELKRLVRDTNRVGLELASINFLNQYAQYYGNNLGHTNWYNTLRLAEVYLGKADYEYLVDLFNRTQHTFTRLSHNAYFNQVYMSQGGWTSQGPDDPYTRQLFEDLADFRQAPNQDYYLEPRDQDTYKLDPVSVSLDALFEQVPVLRELLGDVNPQATEAFPVPLQCSSDFLWQRNPFRIEACGQDDPASVHPGVDYLMAYWLAGYHKYLDKSL